MFPKKAPDRRQTESPKHCIACGPSAPSGKQDIETIDHLRMVCGPGMARGERPAKGGRKGSHPYGTRLLPGKAEIRLRHSGVPGSDRRSHTLSLKCGIISPEIPPHEKTPVQERFAFPFSPSLVVCGGTS
jgi:hypothetical protein